MFIRGYVVWTMLAGLLGFLMMIVRASPSAVPAHCGADVGLKDPQNRQIQVLCGDYTVRAVHETWEPKRHYKVFGNLIIQANKALDIRDSTESIIIPGQEGRGYKAVADMNLVSEHYGSRRRVPGRD